MTATQTLRQAPETLHIDAETLGGHGQHWQLLAPNALDCVPDWLQRSLDDANAPYGLHRHPDHLPQTHWLIQGAEHSAVQVTQVIRLDANQHPIGLYSTYPSVDSPHAYTVKIDRILSCAETQEAILQISTSDGSRIHAFDTLFAINQQQYQRDTEYLAYFSALAHQLEKVGAAETLLVDDPATIRHHRALNDILAKNNGVAPADLQQQLEQWQAQNADDEAPVNLNLSQMAAYLFGETLGQEDEAWFQGEIIGKSSTIFMDYPLDLYDVVILREQGSQPFVIRIASANQLNHHQSFSVGEYIRGNIWMQISIHAKT